MKNVSVMRREREEKEIEGRERNRGEREREIEGREMLYRKGLKRKSKLKVGRRCYSTR